MVSVLQSQEVNGGLNLIEIWILSRFVNVVEGAVLFLCVATHIIHMSVYHQAITWTNVSLLLIKPLVAKECNLNRNGSCSFARNAFRKSTAKYRLYIQALICERTLIDIYIYIWATSFIMFHDKLRQPVTCRIADFMIYFVCIFRSKIVCAKCKCMKTITVYFFTWWCCGMDKLAVSPDQFCLRYLFMVTILATYLIIEHTLNRLN